MSVAGYLVPVEPKGRVRNGLDHSVEERLQTDSVETATLPRLEGGPLPGGLKRARHENQFYEDVEEYDPVLKAHCRL